MARSNSNQSNATTPAATANPQDKAEVKDSQAAPTSAPDATTDNAGGDDKITDEKQDLNEMQKAGQAKTHPQPDDPALAAAPGTQSQAQKANEAVRPESALHNLKSKELTRVRFTHPWQRYSPGDRAGFDPKTAADLVKRNIAESL
ncbi:hypothetical protein [Salinicola halophyticus]|uniref:hypothetical protein n=1 Tax=Salinicola halophyticus TaxID=1808881 RepID=UPI003F44753F